jgi:hypothetical protein
MLADERLTKPEHDLWERVGTGELLDLRASRNELNDPAQGGSWGADRTVRAELLVELLTGQRQPHDALEAKALNVRGARITGTLNLEATTLVCPVRLEDCSFAKPIILREARAPAVRLPGCHMPGLKADRLETHGILALNHGFTAHGEVSLFGACIGGQLYGDGAKLINPEGRALFADWLTVNQGLHCHKLIAEGEVRLPGAHISGTLELDGARLTNLPPDQNDEAPAALVADGLRVQGSMFCRAGFTAKGTMRLLRAQIGGQLNFEGAILDNQGREALIADGLTVDQSMVCGAGGPGTEEAIAPNKRFRADGEVALAGAHIGGQLTFRGASLTNPGGRALTADKLTVDTDVFFGKEFNATGAVRLIGAHIGGQLYFEGACLTNPNGPALDAYRLTVGDDMSCDGFVAKGEMRLTGARIGGGLHLTGAYLRRGSPDQRALDAYRLTVGDDMSCDGFVAKGEMRLTGARIGGGLHLTGACLVRGSPTRLALNAGRLSADSVFFDEWFAARGQIRLHGARIAGQLGFSGVCRTNTGETALELQEANIATLFLTPQQPPAGVVDLVEAQVGVLIDNEDNWPAAVRLRGLVYDTPAKGSVQERLRWLERDRDGYSPQPYEQLAAAYRRTGNDEAARQVAVAQQRRRRATLAWPGKLWSGLMDVLVGYGYRTWQAGLWLAALLLASVAVFAHAHAHQQLTPAKPPSELQHFNPLVYTLDVLLPIVNLGQEGGWVPHRLAAVCFWVLTLAGWVLTTAVVAGLTGVLKRE